MTPPGPPPPPSHPGQGQQGRPHGGLPPMNPLQQQQRAMMQHALVHQNQNQLVKTFDLEEERPIDHKRARDELTTYHVYRFEADDEAETEEDYVYGKRKSKSWGRIKRTEFGGEKRTVAKQIQALGRSNESVIDKKKALPSALQLALEKTLQELQSNVYNPLLFETNLVQLDYPDVPTKDWDSDKEDRYRRTAKASRNQGIIFPTISKPTKKRSHKSSEKVKREKRRTRQPTSILAYYKTSPLSTVDVLGLYHQDQAKRYQTQTLVQPPQPEFYHPGHQGPPQNPGSFHHEGPPRPQGGGGGPVRGPEGHGGGVRVVEGRGPPVRVVTADDQPARGPPRGQPVKPGDRPANPPVNVRPDDRSRSRSRDPHKRVEVPRPPKRPTPPSSPESNRSNPWSDRDSDSTYSNTSGSSEDNRRQYHGRKPALRKGGFHGRPEYFGINGDMLPHEQRRFSQHRIDDPSGGLPGFAPRMQMVPDMEEVRTEAYLAGKADAQRDARELVAETLAQVTGPPLSRPMGDRFPPGVLNDAELHGRMGRMRLVEDEYEEDEWCDFEVDDRRTRYFVPIRTGRGPGYRDEKFRRASEGFDDRHPGHFRVRRGASLDDRHILANGQHTVMKERGRDDGLRQMRAEHIGPRPREASYTRMSPTERDIGEDAFAYGTSRNYPPPKVGVRGLGPRDDESGEIDGDYVMLNKPGRG